MKKTHALLALCASMAAPLSLAAGLPMCFRMTEDPQLNRFYAVMPNTVQSPVQASPEKLPVVVFEYYVVSYAPPERRLHLEAVMTGTAGVMSWGVSDVQVASAIQGGVMSSTFMRGSDDTWTLDRNTGWGTTRHAVKIVPCTVPAT